jgi:hypothetical protein
MSEPFIFKRLTINEKLGHARVFLRFKKNLTGRSHEDLDAWLNQYGQRILIISEHNLRFQKILIWDTIPLIKKLIREHCSWTFRNVQNVQVYVDVHTSSWSFTQVQDRSPTFRIVHPISGKFMNNFHEWFKPNFLMSGIVYWPYFAKIMLCPPCCNGHATVMQR